MASFRSPLSVLLVDPSLFTAPYDAALTEGLLSAGMQVCWATRPTRKGDRHELPLDCTDPFFYRRVDQLDWLPGPLKAAAKGIAHLGGLLTLLGRVRSRQPDVVHLQWVVVPPLDVLAMALIRRWRPLVFTVHDTVPFNGQKMSWLQRFGHDGPLRQAHRLIVHTRSGREALLARGVPAEKIAVIPHGPLRLSAIAPPRSTPRDPRWTCVLFGEIKPYKGLDLLIDAVAALPEEDRTRLRVVVAGRPRMDIAPLIGRIAAQGLDAQFDVRPQRQSEEQMAVLFDEADCFVFPYRQIDASGVYFLVKGRGKWLIASRVGIFQEDIAPHLDGELVPPEDVDALSKALQHGVRQRPAPDAERAGAGSWVEIGRSTLGLYRDAIAAFDGSARASLPGAAE